MKLLARYCALCIAICMCAAGCNRSTVRPNGSSTESGPGGNSLPDRSAAPKPPTTTDADLAKATVNESGQIPILEYHNIQSRRGDYYRSPAQFRGDLDTLYREGYRPVSLRDYLDNHIDVPLGMTPVVFTFDDGSRTQFHYQADGSLDPDCAYAILKVFHDAHPDFALRGVFYLNASPTGSPAPVFADEATAAKKVKELLAAGFEVGNHTVTHAYLNRLSDAAVQKELAGCVVGIHSLVPEATVDTLALPFGLWPKDRKLAESGEDGGVQYHNRAVLLVGANPAPAPCGVKFNPIRLPRIQAYGGNMGSDKWLKWFEAHPTRRYVSDGDPNAVTVPKSQESKIDPARLGATKLRTY